VVEAPLNFTEVDVPFKASLLRGVLMEGRREIRS
jgi:hypothetical protein